MFTVVEDEEEGAWASPVTNVRNGSSLAAGSNPRAAATVSATRRGSATGTRSATHPIGVCVDEPASHLLREPCLAGTTHPGERE
jgi:hypothetical protein